MINFLVQMFGEAIDDEWVEGEDISEENEIVEDFEGLQDDDDYYFVESLVLITPRTHFGLVVMPGRGGTMIDV
jgi:hypothetical protein